MSIQYYHDSPFFSISDFHRFFDDAVSAFVARGNGQRHQGEQNGFGTFQPRVDVHESSKDNTLTATFDLPGMKKEDITVDIHNNRLVVSGEFGDGSEAEKEGYIIRERRSGKFSRTLPLPCGIPAEQIKAVMENGLLTVTFPKASPEQAAKRVAIA